jgi:hypothetical protein
MFQINSLDISELYILYYVTFLCKICGCEGTSKMNLRFVRGLGCIAAKLNYRSIICCRWSVARFRDAFRNIKHERHVLPVACFYTGLFFTFMKVQ